MNLTWADIRHYLNPDTPVIDEHGVTWHCTDDIRRDTLCRRVNGKLVVWRPDSDDPLTIPVPPIPEPPDGSRIEFEYGTDRFAAWRDDEESVKADWPAGDGGWVWCVYPETVPKPWSLMWLMFGESLRSAIRLVPEVTS